MSNLRGRKVVRKDIESMDVAPSVLDLLEVEVNFDGRSLLRHTRSPVILHEFLERMSQLTK